MLGIFCSGIGLKLKRWNIFQIEAPQFTSKVPGCRIQHLHTFLLLPGRPQGAYIHTGMTVIGTQNHIRDATKRQPGILHFAEEDRRNLLLQQIRKSFLPSLSHPFAFLIISAETGKVSEEFMMLLRMENKRASFYSSCRAIFSIVYASM